MALDPCHNIFFYYYICLLSNSSQILDTFPNTSFLSAYLQASQRQGATHTHAHLCVCWVMRACVVAGVVVCVAVRAVWTSVSCAEAAEPTWRTCERVLLVAVVRQREPTWRTCERVLLVAVVCGSGPCSDAERPLVCVLSVQRGHHGLHPPAQSTGPLLERQHGAY